jgi:AraC family transcriptional regulator
MGHLPAERPQEVTAMMTPPFSFSGMPNQNLRGGQTPWQAASHSSFDERHVEELKVHRYLAPEEASDLFDATVQISPIDAVKRHSTGRNGLIAESIYASAGSKIEFRFDAPVHLLIMYDEGTRREGETSIDGMNPSGLRNLADKLTFVPAGHGYHEWHETSTPTRITYLYFDPSKLQNVNDTDVAYVPKILFEDSILWETAAKLKSVIESESRQARGKHYSEALAKVLLHELPRAGQGLALSSPVNRGGLATWQMRAVTSYVEEHVTEQISLATLARLARLSEHHFCRAFKQSFGIPPHRYHVQRRIERAKFLLADRANSVTDVALSLGYSQSSAFSVAFRKTTGRTPKEFRRDFT